MNLSDSYLHVTSVQSQKLNDRFALLGDDAFYDGCEIKVQFNYIINDDSFDHAFGTEKQIGVEILDVFATLNQIKVNVDDLFQLTPEQIDHLKITALRYKQQGEPNYEPFYPEDE